MEKFIIAGGVATRCSDVGKGEEPIVLIHGYLESLDVWDSFAGQLGKTHRVISVDLPGSGLSDWGGRDVIDIDFMANVVSDTLASLSVPAATIVGHSMGGYVACALAELFPSQVAKLILFHSAPTADSEEKKEYRAREIELIKNGKKELLASVNPARGFAPQNVGRCTETIDELTEQTMLTDDSAIIATLKGMSARKDRSQFFDAFSAQKPALIVFGAFDPYITPDVQAKLKSDFEHAQTALLDNSAHMGFVEQQAQSLTIVTSL